MSTSSRVRIETEPHLEIFVGRPPLTLFRLLSVLIGLGALIAFGYFFGVQGLVSGKGLPARGGGGAGTTTALAFAWVVVVGASLVFLYLLWSVLADGTSRFTLRLNEESLTISERTLFRVSTTVVPRNSIVQIDAPYARGRGLHVNISDAEEQRHIVGSFLDYEDADLIVTTLRRELRLSL